MSIKQTAKELFAPKDLSRRYRLIDALRGLSIINMVIFHLMYDIYVIGGLDTDFPKYPLVIAWERYICISFIMLSGISLHFSRHPYRRGITVSVCGLLVTLVTVLALPSQAVWFGVLNLIGAAMIICAAVRPIIDRLHPIAGFLISPGLFALSYGVPTRFIGFFGVRLLTLPESLYKWRPLAVLGFPDKRFFSSDFFPLIPWLFVFLMGYFLWAAVKRCGICEMFRRGFRPLDFLGRHSLIIYLIHQPVLYFIVSLFQH